MFCCNLGGLCCSFGTDAGLWHEEQVVLLLAGNRDGRSCNIVPAVMCRGAGGGGRAGSGSMTVRESGIVVTRGGIVPEGIRGCFGKACLQCCSPQVTGLCLSQRTASQPGWVLPCSLPLPLEDGSSRCFRVKPVPGSILQVVQHRGGVPAPTGLQAADCETVVSVSSGPSVFEGPV